MREYGLGIAHTLDPVLPSEQAERLRSAGRKVRFAQGEFLYHQGEAADCAFMLVAGRANTLLINSRGQESLLRIHLVGSVLGLTALASAPVRDASAVAVDACETVAISRANLSALLRDDPALGEAFIRLLVDRMSDFHYRVGELLSQSIKQRLAQALLSLSRPDWVASSDDTSGPILLTHQQLAQLINARRPTVSAVIGRFTRAGLIARSGPGLVVIDRNGLAKVAVELPRS